MTWGSGPWGSGPWGSGSPPGSPADDTPDIANVRFLASTYIRVSLTGLVVAITDYLDPENYTITVRDDTPLAGVEVRVLRVFAPTQSVLTTSDIYLETTPHTIGAAYEIAFGQLQNAQGVTVYNLEPSPYQARVSKTMSMLKNLPSHFDKRLESLMHALVTAISVQDDIIGGSKSDRFP